MPKIEKLIGQWLPPPIQFNSQPLTNHTGLSGAQLWKIAANDQHYCLRRWPQHVSRERLEEIHRLLLHLGNRGSLLTPTPLLTVDEQTIVHCNSSHWELARWLPGEALTEEAPTPRISAALEKLAEVHSLAANLSTGSIANRQRSPGLAQRDAVLRLVLKKADRRQLASTLANSPSSLRPSLTKAFDLLETNFTTIHQAVAKAAQLVLPMQWRIGDIHREHVLFTGNRVTGVVDIGAACIDSPVADVARLLASIAGDDANLWRVGLAAYQSVRPFAAEELAALPAFDAGGAAAAVVRWIQWLGVEQREFPREKVRNRLDYLTRRLEALAKRGRVSVI